MEPGIGIRDNHQDQVESEARSQKPEARSQHKMEQVEVNASAEPAGSSSISLSQYPDKVNPCCMRDKVNTVQSSVSLNNVGCSTR